MVQSSNTADDRMHPNLVLASPDMDGTSILKSLEGKGFPIAPSKTTHCNASLHFGSTLPTHPCISLKSSPSFFMILSRRFFLFLFFFPFLLGEKMP